MDRRGRATRGSAAEFICWGPTLQSVQMNEQCAFVVWRRGHMMRINFVLTAAVGWALLSAAAQAGETNAFCAWEPRTRLEALELKTGAVIVKGTTQLGAVP